MAPNTGPRDGKPRTSSGTIESVAPRSAAASTLYDQYNNLGAINLSSQDYEAAYDAYDSQGADDFVVPGGQTWKVTSVAVGGAYASGAGPAASVHVFFYLNAPGNLPGALVASRLASSFTEAAGSGDFVIALATPVTLTSATYWVSVQARQDFGTTGQWNWTYRSVVSNSGAVWQNPGNAFGSGCTSWTRLSTCPAAPATADFVFRLNGHLATSNILYDQYNYVGTVGSSDVTSQDFEPSLNAFDDQAADDFVVPAGETWSITGIDVDGQFANATTTPFADSVNVAFYANGAGNVPGAPLANRPGNGYLDGASSGDLSITLSSPVALSAGTYWVTVQTRQDFDPTGQWFWKFRSVQSNSGGVWRNPGNGFGSGCTNWTRITTCPTATGNPDFVFRLIGNSGPTITSVSPIAGPTGGGQTVTILGTRFLGTSWVGFGGVPATSFTVNSANRITAVTPAHAAGVVNVRVTTPVGMSPDVVADNFTYQGPPTVTSVAPNAGPLGGGQTVTIMGTNFTGTTWVGFGSSAATSFGVVSPSKIIAVTPAHAAGVVNVKVSTPSGLSAIVTASRYTYQGPPTITSVAPNNGPTAGGQTVIIMGTNFTGTNAVSFGGVLAPSFTVVSPTRIDAVTPARAAGVVHIRVNTPSGLSPIVPADQYTFN